MSTKPSQTPGNTAEIIKIIFLDTTTARQKLPRCCYLVCLSTRTSQTFFRNTCLLLQICLEQISKFIFRDETNKFFQNFPICIQQIKLRLVVETQFALENIGVAIVCSKIGEF